MNQKGPQNAFLSALMAVHAAGKKFPLNLVLVCEGEEEIGSPHFGEIVMTPDVLQALKSCAGPGSWPGYRFTNPPLSLPAGGFGLGHGTGAHAPDEYYLIESTNAKVQGLDGAIASFVEILYALA